MRDDELTSPEAFGLAVRARASYLSRNSGLEAAGLRPFSQLTLLLEIGLDETLEELKSRGLRGAYRWALDSQRLATTPDETSR